MQKNEVNPTSYNILKHHLLIMDASKTEMKICNHNRKRIHDLFGCYCSECGFVFWKF